MSANQFDVVEIIAEMPEALRNNVVGALAASINSALVRQAEQAMRAMDAQKIEYRTMEASEIEALFTDPDRNNEAFRQAKAMAAVAQQWRDLTEAADQPKKSQFVVKRAGNIVETKQPGFGSLESTLEFWSKNKLSDLKKSLVKAALTKGLELPMDGKEVNMPELEKLLKAEGFDVEKVRSDCLKLNAVIAEKTAAQTGNIEWLIEHAFGNDEEPDFAKLPEEVRIKLTSVLYNGLTRTYMQGVTGQRYGLTDGDLFICNKLMCEARAYL